MDSYVQERLVLPSLVPAPPLAGWAGEGRSKGTASLSDAQSQASRDGGAERTGIAGWDWSPRRDARKEKAPPLPSQGIWFVSPRVPSLGQ